MYKTQVFVRRCDISMLRSYVFHENIQRSLVKVFRLPQVTQLTVYKTQVTVRRCNLFMLKSEIFR